MWEIYSRLLFSSWFTCSLTFSPQESNYLSCFKPVISLLCSVMLSLDTAVSIFVFFLFLQRRPCSLSRPFCLAPTIFPDISLITSLSLSLLLSPSLPLSFHFLSPHLSFPSPLDTLVITASLVLLTDTEHVGLMQLCGAVLPATCGWAFKKFKLIYPPREVT